MLFLKSFGFYLLNINISVFIYYGKKKNEIKIITVYDDKFLLAFKYKHFMDWIKSKFKDKYDIKK